LLRIDLEALVRGRVTGDEVCEITGLGPIPIRLARQLLGDSILHLVITRGKDVAATVHLGRGPSAAQKIALLWQQPQCTNSNCHRTHTETDHREPFAKVHETSYENLDPLCDHDHDLKTYQGWALVEGTGRRPLVPPDDPRHTDNQKAPPERGTAQHSTGPPRRDTRRRGPEPPDDTLFDVA
jgi:hypothetical protein